MHPIIEKDKVCVSLGFRRPYPNTAFFRQRGLAGKPHRGTDLAPIEGEENREFILIAPVRGEIVFAGEHSQYGWMVAIESVENGVHYLHFLAHLKRIRKTLKKGGTVRKGELLGLMGSSGTSTAKHLHYQVEVKRKYGKQSHWWVEGSWEYINPKPYLT